MSRPPICIVFRARDGVLALPNAWHLLNLAPEDYVILPTTATATEVERVVAPLVAVQPTVTNPIRGRGHEPNHNKLGRVVLRPNKAKRGPHKAHGPGWKPLPLRQVDKMVSTQAGRFLHIAISLNAQFAVADIYPHLLSTDNPKSVSAAFTIMERLGLVKRVDKQNSAFIYIVTQFGLDKYAELNHACYRRYGLEVPSIPPLVKEPLNA